MTRFLTLAFSTLLLISNISFASSEKIALIVNNTPVTESEIYGRKNFIIMMKQMKNLNKMDHQNVRKLAIDSLIDDILLTAEAESKEISATDEEIKDYIKKIEEAQNLKSGFLLKKFAKNSAIKNSFYAKIKAEVIKSKFVNQFLASQIEVDSADVNQVAIRQAGKDAEITLREFSTYSNEDDSYKQLLSLRKKANNCSKKYKFKNIDIEDHETSFSNLSKEDYDAVNTLKKNEFSAIEDRDGILKMFQICAIAPSSLTDEESGYLTNFVGNKKLNYKVSKYIEKLKNRAYIKVMSN